MAFGLKISALIFLLSFQSNAFAALPAGLAWEVRTTGADTNGGCYDIANDGGTDYSQQDSAQLALSDLAMASTGTTLTSATGGFTAAMVDNCIQITSGTNFTAGYYEITGHTDTNTVTIDRNATTGSAASSGVGNVGGGLATIQEAVDNIVSGNDVYIQDGQYAELVTLPSVNGANGDPVRMIGYVTNHSTVPTGASRPDITGSDTRANAMNVGSVAGWSFENIRFHNATGNGVTGNTSAGTTNRFVNCRFDNNGGIGWSISQRVSFLGCEFDNNTSHGIGVGVGNGTYFQSMYYSYFHDNGGSGVLDGNGTNMKHIIGSVADTNAGEGFFIKLGTLIGNTSYGNTGSGFRQQSGSANAADMIWVDNSSFDNATGFKKDVTTYIDNYFDYNHYEGNTSALSNFTAGANDVTSDALYTDPANGDFTISTSSPLIDAGYPFGSNLGLATSLKRNIGTDHTQAAVGGGGGTNATGAIAVSF